MWIGDIKWQLKKFLLCGGLGSRFQLPYSMGQKKKHGTKVPCFSSSAAARRGPQRHFYSAGSVFAQAVPAAL